MYVLTRHPSIFFRQYGTNLNSSQAASGIENLKMESPVKKLDFTGKENAAFDADTPVVEEIKKPIVEEKKPAAVAPGIKPEEADEPLLQENPNRFVLFPIKYHEVGRVTSCADA